MKTSGGWGLNFFKSKPPQQQQPQPQQQQQQQPQQDVTLECSDDFVFIFTKRREFSAIRLFSLHPTIYDLEIYNKACNSSVKISDLHLKLQGMIHAYTLYLFKIKDILLDKYWKFNKLFEILRENRNENNFNNLVTLLENDRAYLDNRYKELSKNKLWFQLNLNYCHNMITKIFADIFIVVDEIKTQNFSGLNDDTLLKKLKNTCEVWYPINDNDVNFVFLVTSHGMFTADSLLTYYKEQKKEILVVDKNNLQSIDDYFQKKNNISYDNIVKIIYFFEKLGYINTNNNIVKKADEYINDYIKKNREKIITSGGKPKKVQKKQYTKTSKTVKTKYGIRSIYDGPKGGEYITVQGKLVRFTKSQLKKP